MLLFFALFNVLESGYQPAHEILVIAFRVTKAPASLHLCTCSPGIIIACKYKVWMHMKTLAQASRL